MVFSAGVCGPAARGQDDWDVPKKEVNQPVQQVQFGIPDFDSWVLGGRSLTQVESAQKSLLVLQIDSIARASELSPSQREKLQLAGECDLKRLCRAIEQLREKYRGIGQDMNKYQEFARIASEYQAKSQTGIYGDSSLFKKVLAQTLDRQQSDRYQRQERERRQFQYEAKIELVMSNLEGSISLAAGQRQRLVKLLVAETEPPKKFGQYDTYVVFYQLGKLDEAKLKPILDDSQRKSLKILSGRYGGMEPTLRAQGYLP